MSSHDKLRQTQADRFGTMLVALLGLLVVLVVLFVAAHEAHRVLVQLGDALTPVASWIGARLT
jgi:hypothetical protein